MANSRLKRVQRVHQEKEHCTFKRPVPNYMPVKFQNTDTTVNKYPKSSQRIKDKLHAKDEKQGSDINDNIRS